MARPSGERDTSLANLPASKNHIARRTNRYSFNQLEQLWMANGGSKELAPFMAAIALAESGGDPNKDNVNPATGDDSHGLWQINIARNANPEYASYNLHDPNVNAGIAVKLANSGHGLDNWSTWKSGAYKQFLKGHSHIPVVGGNGGGGGGIIGGITHAGGDILHPGRTINSAIDTVAKEAMYALAILGGGMLVLLGLLLVGVDLGLSTLHQSKPAQQVLTLTGPVGRSVNRRGRGGTEEERNPLPEPEG